MSWAEHRLRVQGSTRGIQDLSSAWFGRCYGLWVLRLAPAGFALALGCAPAERSSDVPPPTPAPTESNPCDDPSLTPLEALCCGPVVEPDHRYSGPIADGHIHYFDASTDAFADVLLPEMNEGGVAFSLLSNPPLGPGMLSVSGARNAETRWGELAEVCDRFVPLVGGLRQGDPESVAYAEQQLSTGRFGGVGTLDLGLAGDEIPPDSPWLTELLDVLEVAGGVLSVHAFPAEPDQEAVFGGLRVLAEARPGLTVLCLGCFASIEPWPDNLLHTHVMWDAPSRGSVVGSDSVPASYMKQMDWPVPPPYDSIVEAAASFRDLLVSELPEDEWAAVAHDRLADALSRP